MTLIEWVKDIFKTREVELFEDEKVFVKNGMTVHRDVSKLHELSLGIVSSNTSEEWYRVCRLQCPVGTIIEDYYASAWDELYNDISSLVRNELVKTLLKERFAKSAKTLLDLMERRDKTHFAKNEDSTKISAKVTNEEGSIPLSLEFTVVGQR